MLRPELHSESGWLKHFLRCLTPFFGISTHISPMTIQKGRRPEGSFKLINIFPVATLEMSQSSNLQTRASSPINGLCKFEQRFGSSFLCQRWSLMTAMAEAAKPASCASVQGLPPAVL